MSDSIKTQMKNEEEYKNYLRVMQTIGYTMITCGLMKTSYYRDPNNKLKYNGADRQKFLRRIDTVFKTLQTEQCR